MTKGIVLFAFNNSEIDYIKIAEYAAAKARNFLKVPVTLITDAESADSVKSDIFDKVIVDGPKDYYNRTFRDGNSKKINTLWKNTHRSSAYNLTPYDETLVIDVDYIVNSDTLSYCWEQPHDFLIYKNSYDLSQWRANDQYVSDLSVPFYWATVFYFKKSPAVESFFALVEHIKNNWQYYKFLHQIDSPNFRNDYAFSIAIHMMNGLTHGDFAKQLPGKLYYTIDKDFLIKKKDRDFYFLVQENNSQENYMPLKVSNLDLHIMNKYSLLRIAENE